MVAADDGLTLRRAGGAAGAARDQAARVVGVVDGRRSMLVRLRRLQGRLLGLGLLQGEVLDLEEELVSDEPMHLLAVHRQQRDCLGGAPGGPHHVLGLPHDNRTCAFAGGGRVGIRTGSPEGCSGAGCWQGFGSRSVAGWGLATSRDASSAQAFGGHAGNGGSGQRPPRLPQAPCMGPVQDCGTARTYAACGWGRQVGESAGGRCTQVRCPLGLGRARGPIYPPLPLPLHPSPPPYPPPLPTLAPQPLSPCRAGCPPQPSPLHAPEVAASSGGSPQRQLTIGWCTWCNSLQACRVQLQSWYYR